MDLELCCSCLLGIVSYGCSNGSRYPWWISSRTSRTTAWLVSSNRTF
jgi:hypothetical protein